MPEPGSEEFKIDFKAPGDEESWDPAIGRPLSWRFNQSGSVWRPPTDVYETDDSIVVVLEVAGMRGADIQVTFDENVLYIRGLRQKKGTARAFQQMEISYGEFMAGVRVATSINSSEIEATYSDGFLKVVLPKVKQYTIKISE
ncbi:MAG: Hsp20/alpha crystallin family protein [Anaerolineales bacterium]|nr:Hsp20/alpha crystallin family protein [Anaerolineales bacterium]